MSILDNPETLISSYNKEFNKIANDNNRKYESLLTGVRMGNRKYTYKLDKNNKFVRHELTHESIHIKLENYTPINKKYNLIFIDITISNIIRYTNNRGLNCYKICDPNYPVLIDMSNFRASEIKKKINDPNFWDSFALTVPKGTKKVTFLILNNNVITPPPILGNVEVNVIRKNTLLKTNKTDLINYWINN